MPHEQTNVATTKEHMPYHVKWHVQDTLRIIRIKFAKKTITCTPHLQPIQEITVTFDACRPSWSLVSVALRSSALYLSAYPPAAVEVWLTSADVPDARDSTYDTWYSLAAY